LHTAQFVARYLSFYQSVFFGYFHMFDLKIFSELFFKNFSGEKIYIAFSGGLDSQVLLHVLSEQRKLKPNLNITAIHINHSISKNANTWADACEKACAQLEVPCLVKVVAAKLPDKSGLSQEEYARRLRYQAFSELITDGEKLLTAHHKDDQAETLLIQLFRGAGPKGLAAMPELAKFANGFLFRPLLNFSREELLVYAKEKQLSWIEDESNSSLDFDRNFIRHNLLPIIKPRWPGILQTLSRSAKHFAAVNEILDYVGDSDYQNSLGSIENTLSKNKLLKLDLARRQNVLRYWLAKLNLPIPSAKKITQIDITVLQSKVDAMPIVNWSDAEVRRFGDDVYAFKSVPEFSPQTVLDWDLKKPITLPGGLGELSVTFLGSDQLQKIPTNVTVRFRVGGEKIKLSKHKHSKELKKLFQEWRVPTWQRARIPLVYFADELVAVVGFAIGASHSNFEFFL
jgi:tRNA(Ile)-lysidine synthase